MERNLNLKDFQQKLMENGYFLKGISPNKIIGIYWQRMLNKKTGKGYYEYSVLYPYSRSEQLTLQAEFETLATGMSHVQNR